jgi:hypothetical protein
VKDHPNIKGGVLQHQTRSRKRERRFEPTCDIYRLKGKDQGDVPHSSEADDIIKILVGGEEIILMPFRPLNLGGSSSPVSIEAALTPEGAMSTGTPIDMGSSKQDR